MPNFTDEKWFTNGGSIWSESGKYIAIRQSYTTFTWEKGRQENDSNGCSPCEADSNAFLMATSPEMYHLLEDLSQFLLSNDLIPETQEKINNLLKKARHEDV